MRVSWPVGGGDVDISATKRDGDGNFCISNNFTSPTNDVGPLSIRCPGNPPLDCYYYDCGTAPPDWDGDGTVSVGDPIYGAQSTTGSQPESITVTNLAAGEYLLDVAYWSSGSPTVTIEIFLDGVAAPAFTAAVEVSLTAQWFDVAKVVKREDGSVCIEDILDGVVTDECG